MILIVDFHMILHRSAFAFKNLSLEDGTPTGIIYGSFNMLLNLIKRYPPKDLYIVFDGGPKRRKEICQSYKANRITDRKNEFYQQMTIIRQLLNDLGVKQIYISGEEADDIIGTLAVKLQKEDKIIIVSGDHDFLQLINDDIMVLRDGANGKLYTKDMVELEFGVPPEKLIDVHSLTGDNGDNITGILGYGIKKAVKTVIKYGNIDTVLEKSDTEEKLQFTKEQKSVIMLARTLFTIKTDLEIKINHGHKDLGIVKYLFEKYLRFNSFLESEKWKQIENLSNVGGDIKQSVSV